jgi:hypothetical protein
VLLVQQGDQLVLAVDGKLLENVLQVSFNRRQTAVEIVGDRFVGQALGHQFDHHAFLVGQVVIRAEIV